MNLFDRLVDEALRGQGALVPPRAVVEKQLLHHDILREMSEAGLLPRLTFIGGTCLRACYGASRLSEDLNLAGGAGFHREHLSSLGSVLVTRLEEKYGLSVEVSEPRRETGDVDTWKLKIVARPRRRDLPPQRIHIDICAIPSHDVRPMMLRNPYGVEMGSSGLILRAQSREEILVDKFVALALRKRIKHRDPWDIAWLRQQGTALSADLLSLKLADRRRTPDEFLGALETRVLALRAEPDLRGEFRHEMRRFLPAALAATTVMQDGFWEYLASLVEEEFRRLRDGPLDGRAGSPLRMG